MDKQEARQFFKTQRNHLTHEMLRQKATSIMENLKKMPLWHFFYYHTFLTIDAQKEIPTQFLIHELWNLGKKVIVPKMKSNEELSHFLLTPDTLIQKNKWNIPEPVNAQKIGVESLNVVFVPMLGFDLEGHRVGYGKGFYDRFLAGFKQDVVTVGLCPFDPILKISDTTKLDVPLQYVVTPGCVFRF